MRPMIVMFCLTAWQLHAKIRATNPQGLPGDPLRGVNPRTGQKMLDNTRTYDIVTNDADNVDNSISGDVAEG
jgi:hypothetical protein